MLAAFLSGELPDHLRREIIAYLNTHDEARDMLTMAQDALDAVESGDGAARPAEPEVRLTRSGGRRPWASIPVDDKGHWKVTAFFAGAVLVLAITVALMALNTSRLQDALRGNEWSPVVSAGDVTLQWQPVPGASSYQVMRFDADADEASIIARTGETQLEINQVSERADSSPVWILAFSDEGTLLERSEPVYLNQNR